MEVASGRRNIGPHLFLLACTAKRLKFSWLGAEVNKYRLRFVKGKVALRSRVKTISE